MEFIPIHSSTLDSLAFVSAMATWHGRLREAMNCGLDALDARLRELEKLQQRIEEVHDSLDLQHRALSACERRFDVALDEVKMRLTTLEGSPRMLTVQGAPRSRKTLTEQELRAEELPEEHEPLLQKHHHVHVQLQQLNPDLQLQSVIPEPLAPQVPTLECSSRPSQCIDAAVPIMLEIAIAMSSEGEKEILEFAAIPELPNALHHQIEQAARLLSETQDLLLRTKASLHHIEGLQTQEMRCDTSMLCAAYGKVQQIHVKSVDNYLCPGSHHCSAGPHKLKLVLRDNIVFLCTVESARANRTVLQTLEDKFRKRLEFEHENQMYNTFVKVRQMGDKLTHGHDGIRKKQISMLKKMFGTLDSAGCVNRFDELRHAEQELIYAAYDAMKNVSAGIRWVPDYGKRRVYSHQTKERLEHMRRHRERCRPNVPSAQGMP